MAPDQVPPNNFPNTLANYAIRQYARGMTTSPETSQRDELARTLMDASAYAWEKDGSRHWPNMADMLLAAGYRKPRTITTAEELAALVEDTVIRDYDTCICERVGGYWNVPADGTAYGDSEITLPATVLWEPQA